MDNKRADSPKPDVQWKVCRPKMRWIVNVQQGIRSFVQKFLPRVAIGNVQDKKMKCHIKVKIFKIHYNEYKLEKQTMKEILTIKYFT